jgi:hypothetical protein
LPSGSKLREIRGFQKGITHTKTELLRCSITKFNTKYTLSTSVCHLLVKGGISIYPAYKFLSASGWPKPLAVLVTVCGHGRMKVYIPYPLECNPGVLFFKMGFCPQIVT